MRKIRNHVSRAGSTLVTSVVLLSVAGFTLGAVITVNMSYSKQAEMAMYREKAVYLADAGLNAAIVDLNNASGSDGIISFEQSKAYFSDQTPFSGTSDWGFKTEMQVIGGKEVLVSTGKYRNSQQKVQSGIVLGAGSRSIHALYAHALFAGNYEGSNYVLEVGGTGYGADFVRGDVYSGGDITLTGSAFLRLPEILNEVDFDGIWNPTNETWVDAYTSQIFTNPLTVAQFNAYKSSMAPYMDLVYNNGRYDYGEAFADSEGNGLYDVGEAFTDSNGNGVRDAGDGYIDNNGNEIYDEGIDTIIDNGSGVWDEGEEWTDGFRHYRYYQHNISRNNGRYDLAGQCWYHYNGHWYDLRWSQFQNWPAEAFEDSGDGNFDPGEPWVDGNGLWDESEQYVDDRNGIYDYGTQAYGSISGMPSPAAGQRATSGGDYLISPPDLLHMYYQVSKEGTRPAGARARWGHDVAVTAEDYTSNGKLITDVSSPEHIFVRNVRQSPPGYGNGYYRDNVGGVTVRSRGYNLVHDDAGNRVDDYFLEDPTESSYTRTVSADSIDGTSYTAPSYINVRSEDNVKVYYVEGNVYLHASPTFALKFKEPGTRITIVAKGNITISDEFYYNAGYDPELQRSDLDSTIVNNPMDALALIALKNPDCTDSGNIYIGDQAHGTGGAVHALLYAENNFVDNNLNTANQQFISIFGNMTAGNQVKINREGDGGYRTRLDVTLDERIRNGTIVMPGLPAPVGYQRGIQLDTAWHLQPGTWNSYSGIQ